MTIEEFKQHVIECGYDDLSYMLGRYGGPYNVTLRMKEYGIKSTKLFDKIIIEEMAMRSIEVLLADESDV